MRFCPSQLLLCVLASIFSCLVSGKLVAQENESGSPEFDERCSWEKGWLKLFDQHTNFGWRGGAAQAVKDERLLLTSQDPLLRSSAQFACFTIMVRYRLSAAGKAELLLRTSPQATQSGIDHISIPLPADRVILWAECPCRIESQATSVRYWQGDEDRNYSAQTLTLATEPQRGYIGFRVTAGHLEIESVMIRPLLTGSVDLGNLQPEGWDVSNLGEARAEAQDGIVTLQGGPGYLVSRPSFADFILVLEARTQVGTNSGVFFRCIPGESLNGYESQIHNGYLNGDREQPEDCGTGGIFRRVNARRVVADDGQWFRKVIIACGGQISVWVNGYQVTDWSDQRPPNVNPRRGRRLAGGPLMLQAHDPATHLEFRQMQVQELPPR